MGRPLDPRLVGIADGIPDAGIGRCVIVRHAIAKLLWLRAEVVMVDGAVVAWINPVTQSVERLDGDQVANLRPVA